MKAGLLEKEEGLSAIVSEDGIATTSTNQPQKNKLGTVLGVYLPCILGIFGAILFLRLPWAVGQLGLFGGLLVRRSCCCFLGCSGCNAAALPSLFPP